MTKLRHLTLIANVADGGRLQYVP